MFGIEQFSAFGGKFLFEFNATEIEVCRINYPESFWQNIF